MERPDIITVASLFFLPFVDAFPEDATAAALLVIGLLMLAQFRIGKFQMWFS